ncbi:ZF-HD protein dimerization region protein [Medicago truncatula]|uniref:ZF-HD protein dimerization region protein n=1 Tax=Medicago truncatula TaxID=3880 RepID=A0A072UB00_MEDTR|nr:ZF-HD protein dimerization region protein [Medicago truncatula]
MTQILFSSSTASSPDGGPARSSRHRSISSHSKLTVVVDGRKGNGNGGFVLTMRYRECQKNHVVSFGGHVVDGSCEFIAADEEGTLEAVICAA